eukprot:CAMPEP_0197852806 /NCGR_PEP_ID=MMETSP1438-20131217/21454_1 /TAXON_ID=1461541 /ORGANISM="Pterosperma sp., Strain CCMP1384" /LENGTH=126 /DNA_ID=CAMNT_0043466997 /DNA_START=21 /DNA_END=398 /DNA_ORIENTATION=-
MDTFSPVQGVHWGPHPELFHTRVGQHPARLRNLHFVFAVMARAVSMLGPHLERVLLEAPMDHTMDHTRRNHIRALLQELVSPPVDAVGSGACSDVLGAFDASSLFNGPDGPELKVELERRLIRMGE